MSRAPSSSGGSSCCTSSRNRPAGSVTPGTVPMSRVASGMKVLRRGADNVVQFASFMVLAVVLLAVRRDLPSAAMSAPLVVLAVRAARNGLYVDDDAVVVRNT